LGFAIGLLVILGGLFIADATTGPFVGGLRLFGKYLIFFALPMACLPSAGQLRNQMLLLLALALIQLPVTVWQRFFQYAGSGGDFARGTVGTGAFNAIILISVSAGVVGAYCKKKIRPATAVILATVLLLPPALAEVKTAFILMPFAILFPILHARSANGDTRPSLASGVLVFVLALGAFVVTLDTTENTLNGRHSAEGEKFSLLALLTDKDRLLNYLAPQASGANTERYGRIDGLLAPFSEFKDRPMLLLTGLGLGAITNSPIESFSADQHIELAKSGKGKSTYGRLLWEVGLLGMLLVLIGLAMLWRDARFLCKEQTEYGALGLAMTAIVPIFVIAFFWRYLLTNNTVMCLLAYFAGLVVAKAAQLRQTERAQIRDHIFSKRSYQESCNRRRPNQIIDAENSGSAQLQSRPEHIFS